jgi:thiamine biosynthesis lipoprotein
MGCEIVVGGAGRREAQAIEDLFHERDRRFSRFRAGSELNAVNAARGPVLVSEPFAEAVAVALEAAAATDGLVDPTLGAAIAAAGYVTDLARIRNDSQLVAQSHKPGRGAWRRVRLTGRLLRLPPGVELDLNGVVKSLAADDAVGLLSGPGFVSAGGDLAANAPVDVALPGGGAVRVVEGGIATSGTVVRRWLRNGVEQHHLIDPRTGTPSRSRWTQVTVVGATCVAADVCAKAAFLTGAAGPAWLDARGLPGRFLSSDEETLVNRTWAAALARGRQPTPVHACI